MSTSAATTAGDFLATMAASSRVRAAAARATLPTGEALARALAAAAPLPVALSPQGFDLIAEVKFRSPAMGALQAVDDAAVGARVAGYAGAGAAAVSVLTEPDRFDGSLAHLAGAVQSLAGRVPAMRKDFLVDPVQLVEARLAGAGGALLIIRMLDDDALDVLLAKAAQLGLFVLLEAFDEADIERAHALVARHAGALQLLVGVNCRDLRTLQVVPGRLESLAHLLPDGVARVAESGVATAADAARVAAAGYTMALVGGALMSSPDPFALVRDMLAAGRAARTQAKR